VKFFDSDSAYKINLVVGMKYLNFKNEEVLLGFDSQDTVDMILAREFNKHDPKRMESIEGTYLVDLYPVTNCEFMQVMWDSIPEDLGDDENLNTWILRKKHSVRNDKCDIHDSAASMVSLYQALKYANARSIRDGLKPYYKFSNTISNKEQIRIQNPRHYYIIGYYDFKGYRNKTIGVKMDSTSDGYRLPYYDEWMMLARGGDKEKKTPWGNSSAFFEITKYAKFDAKIKCSALERNKPLQKIYEKIDFCGKEDDSGRVGLLKPNGYGLYDMFGLVAEHVLFDKLTYVSQITMQVNINFFQQERHDLNCIENCPSCLKGGGIHDNWQTINYGYSSPNNDNRKLAGFRLIRNIGNNAKWTEVKADKE
jgi:formylglycine-generating enzyme required for sulfatase activity